MLTRSTDFVRAVGPVRAAMMRGAPSRVLIVLVMILAWCATPAGVLDAGQQAGEAMTQDIEVEVVTPPVYPVPVPGQETRIPLALRIINRRTTPLRFNQFDTVYLLMTDAAGTVLRMDGGRDRTRIAETISPPIAPQDSLVIERPARLLWRDDGSLRLVGDDEFGSVWYIDDIHPGSYLLQFRYENQKTRDADGPPIWTGKAATPAAEVELR